MDGDFFIAELDEGLGHKETEIPTGIILDSSTSATLFIPTKRSDYHVGQNTNDHVAWSSDETDVGGIVLANNADEW